MSNFNIKELQKEKFYQLPKVFFTNPKYTKLSNDAKITWSILRDRLDLSIRNNWIDENGDIFFIYTNEKLKSILNISSPNKLSKIKKELTQANLFNQVRVGLNKPNKLYIKKPEVTEADIYYISQQENDIEPINNKDVSKSYVQNYDNNTSKSINIIHQDIFKSYANDTEFNNTDYIKTENNDTNDLNDTCNIITKDETHSHDSKYFSHIWDNQDNKEILLQNFPEELTNYLLNFNYQDLEIIKSIILKAKESFNTNHDEAFYMLEQIEYEILAALKRFKKALRDRSVKGQAESVNTMQGYLMRTILSELEEMHAARMRNQNMHNIFRQ
ncbi:replication initiator protein A [Staphylococcus kloosii]|uniref:replication initiator protein A n=1 Tax=Staphylococcus kloosii TaxID=29384 RepID=UPI0028A57515|nr:replication initiator protein A [Staphylococcus kloosii]MDT3959808.1 replication initiator protein A [Staphylococcus kloosii]